MKIIVTEDNILDIYNPEYSLEVLNKISEKEKKNYYWENKQGNLIRLDNIDDNYMHNIKKLLEFAIKRDSVPIDDFNDALRISECDYDMYI